MGRGATPLVRVDADGRVVALNDVARELLGDAVGEPCSEVMCASDPDGVVCNRDCALNLLSRGETRFTDDVAVRDVRGALTCSPLDGGLVVALTPDVPARAPKVPLSAREVEIVELVARGHTNDRIARRLGISASTVRTHIERLLEKLGARSRAEAVARALATGELRLR